MKYFIEMFIFKYCVFIYLFLFLDPLHPRAIKNLKFYLEKIREEAQKTGHSDTKKVNESPKQTGNKTKIIKNYIDSKLTDEERYKKLCRGEHLRVSITFLRQCIKFRLFF